MKLFDMDAATLWLLLHSWIIAIALMGIAIVLATVFYHQENKTWKSAWKWVERNLYIGFGICWIFGFAVYAVGMYVGIDSTFKPFYADSWLHLLGVTPMAVLHAFGMFVLNSDVSEVYDEFHKSLLYMTLFSFAHFFAALVSMLFVIKHFGYNLIAGLRLWHTSYFGSRRNELFVFWGTNEASFQLAKDIRGRLQVSKDSRTIIVRTSDDSEGTGSRTAIERFFNFLSTKNQELEKFKELDCLTTNAFSRLSKLEFTPLEQAARQSPVLNEMLNLRAMTRIMTKTSSHIHIFFLGDNEKDNIKATGNILNDKDLSALSKDRKITIYCHAHYDGVNRVVEDELTRENVEVRIIDSSHDSINLLQKNPQWHPINCIDIDSKENLGTTSSLFCSLVVGFGQTGRDAVRFLYEYGAFVDSKSTENDVRRSRFHCHVIDEKMDELEGRFFANAPSLKNVRKNHANQDVYIDTIKAKIGSDDFYSHLETICHDVNYVVVALGDDELNIATAVNIYNYIRTRRTDESMRKLRILVHCKSDLQEQHISKIADHYNQIHSVHNKQADEDKRPLHPIEIFGTIDQLFSYSQIVKNDFEEEGHIYNEEYCKVSGNNGKKDKWNTRRQHWIEQGGLNDFSKLRRQEAQDVSNAYHAQTKIAIMKMVIEARGDMLRLNDALQHKQDAPVFCRNLTGYNQPLSDGPDIDERNYMVVQGGYSEAEKLLLHNLARMEHLRWNAAHEVLGYQSYAGGDADSKLVEKANDRHQCNEQFKLHNCLIPWQKLDKESIAAGSGNYYPDYKLYDYCVLTTSIKLYKPNSN